jgi:glycosyltransferase involved in cell wall biosynthesis
MTRIAYIGTYVPRRCGIATFTHHLRLAVGAAAGGKGSDLVIALANRPDEHAYGTGVHPVVKDDRSEYRRAAEAIRDSGADLVSLQHEFGIFGGEAGEYVLDLLESLQRMGIPVVTTFHTVFARPEEPYRGVQQRIADMSDRIIVMTRTAVRYVAEAFGVPRERIACIPHGTPQPPRDGRNGLRERLGWNGRKVVMSFGLLSRGKGLETVIRALPRLIERAPDALYAIVGQTHPEVAKFEGESYRAELRALAAELGVGDHLLMIDRYIEEDELAGMLTACDIYVTPYPGMRQITSGTLAYAVGLGRPVLSTPYVYARDLLADIPELLVPPSDSDAWAEALAGLLGSEERLERIGRRIARIGAAMHWPAVGREHLKLFRRVARAPGVTAATAEA